MTLAVTGLLGGIAGGSALGGWMAEHVSATAGFGVPVAAAAVALMITLGRACLTPGVRRDTESRLIDPSNSRSNSRAPH